MVGSKNPQNSPFPISKLPNHNTGLGLFNATIRTHQPLLIAPHHVVRPAINGFSEFKSMVWEVGSGQSEASFEAKLSGPIGTTEGGGDANGPRPELYGCRCTA